MVRTRKDVWRLGAWDDTLLWYARAIANMQTLPINDPSSWRYQAAIHDYIREFDPLADPSDTLPSTSQMKRFWSQCQHNSWFFLPWHRMYLAFFEQIVAKFVADMGGPSDWALPYWNYSDQTNSNARRLPPAFRSQNLPDGSINPLRVEERVLGANDGDELGDMFDIELETCLEEPLFISVTGGEAGFGGPHTIFNHSEGDVGDVERVPHGSMHGAVGGLTGWMSAFNTAALDPVFWLHHCNIDRLWSVWLRRNSSHLNPTENAWLTEVPFDFHDADGNIVTMTPSQVVTTTAAPLLYEYEDTSDPLPSAPPMADAAKVLTMKEPVIPEMVGATDQPLTLAGERTTTSLQVNQPTGPAAMAAMGDESGSAGKRVHLKIENITSTGLACAYSVYVNLPEGADPANYPELHAGVLPMFGVVESSDPSRGHAGSGLQYTLDITEVVRALESMNGWNPDTMKLTFVPKQRQAGAAAPTGAPVQVGRVSLYYS